MKRLAVFLSLMAAFNLIFGQTDFIKYGEVKTSCGAFSTPKEIIQTGDVIDTFQLAKQNFFGASVGLWLNEGWGLRGSYSLENSFFDTTAYQKNDITVGLAFRKAGLAPGELYSSGFNYRFEIDAGYINHKNVSGRTYMFTETDSSYQVVRTKTYHGVYANAEIELFRDDPMTQRNFWLYSVMVYGGLKYPIFTKIGQTVADVKVDPEVFREDSVNVWRAGFEIKPVCVPLSDRLGLSLLGGVEYSNFSPFAHGSGINYRVGLTLDGFANVGEALRIVYSGGARGDYKFNGVTLEVDVLPLIRGLFVRR